MASNIFNPALIIVDLQEDFCPPNGSLAVEGGRDVIPIVNQLLDLPFTIKIATKDWHPQDHVSFASNHSSKVPFVDMVTIVNPLDPSQSYESRLWPDHCVQDTPGARLVPELKIAKVHKIIEKGQEKNREMYSAFCDPFGGADSGVAKVLQEQGVTDVYVVGLAFDYCVKATAVSSQKEGFKTWVIQEGTRPVNENLSRETTEDLERNGVGVVRFEGSEVEKVREYKG